MRNFTLIKQFSLYATLTSLLVFVWFEISIWWSETGGIVTEIVGGTAAVVLGIVFSHIAHDWGHFFGLRLAGGNAIVKDRISPLFFEVDLDRITQRQFLWFSLGGTIGNWLLVFSVLGTLPIYRTGQTLLWATMVGMTVWAAVLEYSIIASIWHGTSPREAMSRGFERPHILFKSIACGAVTTIALTLLLQG